ncbi:MAG: glycosyltransferase [Anaerolineae bacterium]|nr:glycosyltransferase [Anaerolineae bacterium]
MAGNDDRARGTGQVSQPAPAGISVVVPVYNSQDTLAELVERLEVVLSEVGGPFEIMLVNDASRDRSWDAIARLAQQHGCVVGLDLMRNYGQHNALLAGIRQARFDVIVTMDDDLQNPPEEIPRLLTKLAEGFDVVYGTPQAQQHGFLRNLGSQVTKLALQSAMGAQTARHASPFRAFRAHVRTAFAHCQSPVVAIDVLLTWGTTRFASVPVRHEARRAGRSNYTPRKLAAHAVNMMTGFSTLPLRVASLVGFAFTLFGLGVLVYVLGRFLIEGGSVPGFPFLASVIAIFSGGQLFALGIMGEYLGRMYQRTMDQPPYSIRSVVESGFSPGPAWDREKETGS